MLPGTLFDHSWPVRPLLAGDAGQPAEEHPRVDMPQAAAIVQVSWDYLSRFVVYHQRVDPVIPGKDVRAVAYHQVGQPLAAGRSHALHQFVNGVRGHEQSGGSADAQRVVLAHRLVPGETKPRLIFERMNDIGGEAYPGTDAIATLLVTAACSRLPRS